MEFTNIISLPVELLYEIHIHALSPSFPMVCKHLYAVCNSASASIHAQYLIGRYYEYHARTPRLGIVSIVLRYPLCSESVLEAIIKSPGCPPLKPDARTHMTELPRRFFRNLSPRPTTTGKRKRDDSQPCAWTDDDDPLPFLRYLYNHSHIPRPYADSWDGYALTKAVHAEFIPLVQFLLEQDASPKAKNALAVMVAIRRKNLPLVRLLIERDGPQQFYKRRKTDEGQPSISTGWDGSLNELRQTGRATTGVSAKRRKLGDRVLVNQEMLKTAAQSDARDIVEYFIQEKGCVPDMRTVLLMGAIE
ncbi:hypothetical protein DAEQUDRAFT_808603 [Daedalea quercina L-15889]|uniref:Uncharacterized protein n=1 Tax=Daedalea quercina L-15889 TaxID=1314783 RepID=A0A165T882_9APHY|nr:hypothetical protein DAEQUDRAFT_808603 [Daedalea quercina L-15889]